MTDTLEREGVEKFADSFAELLEGIRAKSGELVPPRPLTSLAPAELVERLWARDATLWTGRDENRWLGWLDEPLRMRQRVTELEEFAAGTRGPASTRSSFSAWAGRASRPRCSGARSRATTCRSSTRRIPRPSAALAGALDPARTLFLVSSKSGTTLETRCHLDFFWDWAGGRAESFAAITDPGSELEALARKRGFRARLCRRADHRRPLLGALSLRDGPGGAHRASTSSACSSASTRWWSACRLDDGNPGLELGERMGQGWKDGRDKVR